MIYVGIDVAKSKHDICILDRDGLVLHEGLTINNDQKGFQELLHSIESALSKAGTDQIKAGLEATGHYNQNLVAFLHSKGIEPVVFNPLQVNQFRKSLTLRRTKTDKVDAKCIAQLLMSTSTNPVSLSYQIQELKSLTRYRSRLVNQRSKLKVSVSRLVDILFPELPSCCSSLSQASIRVLLQELPSARKIATCRIDRLTNLLTTASKGRYSKSKALEIKQLAKQSIGADSRSAQFELCLTLQQLDFLLSQLKQTDKAIAELLATTKTPILSVPGIGSTLAAVILAEIGDIRRFSSPDKLLAFAGLEPSTYQSGQFQATRTSMVKHGSTYLRWALMQAARMASIHCDTFRKYLENKLAQGKHYFVALGHLSKKLVRVLFRILTTNVEFVPQV